MIDLERLKKDMGDLEEDSVLEMLGEVMKEGGSQARDAMEACRKGMDIIGSRFETGEYFVSDLIYAGDIMKEAANILKDALVEGESGGHKGRMILCTVKGDLHDIGKNIVGAMLTASGIDILDLGIDTPTDKIVETAKAENINIIGLSGVLTLAIDSMKNTVEAFKAAGMRERVHIIIGGNPTNDVICKLTGADAWAINPADGVRICQKWLEEV